MLDFTSVLPMAVTDIILSTTHVTAVLKLLHAGQVTNTSLPCGICAAQDKFQFHVRGRGHISGGSRFQFQYQMGKSEAF